MRERYQPSVTQFGGKPVDGWIVVTASGLVRSLFAYVLNINQMWEWNIGYKRILKKKDFFSLQCFRKCQTYVFSYWLFIERKFRKLWQNINSRWISMHVHMVVDQINRGFCFSYPQWEIGPKKVVVLCLNDQNYLSWSQRIFMSPESLRGNGMGGCSWYMRFKEHTD